MEGNNIDIIGAEKFIKNFFRCLNINLPSETPGRFCKMIYELTTYQNISNKEIADTVNKTFEIDCHTNSKNMVTIKDINAFSLCEHHVALMYDMKVTVSYVPNGFVLGFSKIVRMVDMVCKRLQLQEKITSDVFEIMNILTKSNDVAVLIKAKHSCVTARGVCNVSAETVSTIFGGEFSKSDELKALFLHNLK
jgi:GTP cyclohydrolase I